MSAKDRLAEFLLGPQDRGIERFLHDALEGKIPGIGKPNIADYYGTSGRLREYGLGPYEDREHSFYVDRDEKTGRIRLTDESIIISDGK